MKALICFFFKHQFGRWRRVPMGSVMYGWRVRKCKRCGMAEDAPIQPRKRPANGGDTTQPLT